MSLADFLDLFRNPKQRKLHRRAGRAGRPSSLANRLATGLGILFATLMLVFAMLTTVVRPRWLAVVPAGPQRENMVAGRTITETVESTTSSADKNSFGPRASVGGETKRTRTIVEAPPETDIWNRLASPGIIAVAHVVLAFFAAFIVGAIVQRILLGKYAIKAGPVELPELPSQTGAMKQLKDAMLRRGLSGVAGLAGGPKRSEAVTLSLSAGALDAVRTRARALAARLQGARILWIDNNGTEANLHEQQALELLGVTVHGARETSEAETLLGMTHYDLLISNYSRGETSSVSDSGTLPGDLERLLALASRPPVIIYSIAPRPKPAGAFAYTTRPDELIHLVMDAVEWQDDGPPPEARRPE
jgi:hypothetical protein